MKRQPLFICCLYNVALSMLDELALRWPNTVFARALADAIQRAHKDCKNKQLIQ